MKSDNLNVAPAITTQGGAAIALPPSSSAFLVLEQGHDEGVDDARRLGQVKVANTPHERVRADVATASPR